MQATYVTSGLTLRAAAGSRGVEKPEAAMYPFVRMLKEMWKGRRAGPLPLLGTHVSHHVCWPWDLDLWVELNNGRTLTLYDLGRIPLAMRTGLSGVIRAKGWGITVAGNTTRYRRRVRMFDRVEMHSRCIGWDNRFMYMEQSMWKAGECTSHMLLRSAMTSKAGIVPPSEILAAMGEKMEDPPLPRWVQAWIAADAERTWPPER